jgi:hypothetical protein
MSKYRSFTAVFAAGAIALALGAGSALAQGRGQGRGTPPSTPRGKTTTPPSAPRGGPAVTKPIVVQPKLAANLQPLLPGLDVTVAAQGFRNLGGFVSAVHVADNLDIPFVTLKSRIVDDGLSLGQAIQALRPTVNSKTELSKAERQAKLTIQNGGK